MEGGRAPVGGICRGTAGGTAAGDRAPSSPSVWWAGRRAQMKTAEQEGRKDKVLGKKQLICLITQPVEMQTHCLPSDEEQE